MSIKTSKHILSFFGVTFLTLFCIFALEGAASIFNLFRRAKSSTPPVTTTFDAEIGWTGIANLRLQDVFGAGKHYHTDNDGFRANQNKASAVNPVLKVVCSGDSFTQGDQVDDSETWCSRLQEANPLILSKNFGQTGFSPDQSYLYYKRQASKFDHQVHVLAITGPSFIRIVDPSFMGKKKPYLTLKDGALNFAGTPVEKMESQPALFAAALGNFNPFDLNIGKPFLRFIKQPVENRPSSTLPREEIAKIGVELLQEFKEEAVSNKKRFVVVYLPTFQDFYENLHAVLRNELRKGALAKGIEFWDLQSTLQNYTFREISEGGGGHYQQVVYQGIASTLAERLLAPTP